MPALATVDDLSARTPGGITGTSDTARAQAALDDAQALIVEEAGRGALADDALDDWYNGLTPTQRAMLKMVACTSAKRSYANPDGLSTEQLGPYQQGLANSSPDVYLTANELRQVRRLRPTGSVQSVGFTRGPLESHPLADVDAVQATVNPDGQPGEPIAFSEPDTEIWP